MSDTLIISNPPPKRCPKCGSALVSQFIRGLCPNCLALLAFAPEDTGSATVVMETPSALSAKVRLVGDYELLEEIGRGGMGVVFKANQSTLNRTVAVKMILSGEYAGIEERKRFHREATSAAQLQHPNIVAIHQVGEHEGRSYFSMDFIEGQNLSQLLREGKWRPQQAAALVRILADAVHFAHQRGTLHRDLKPHNIIIDAQGEPHILDFGLARPIGEEKGLTQTGDIVGSPSYMSPEQASGAQADVGPATDVYGLGTLLYELITGQAPFTGYGPMEILAKVVNDDPLPPRRLNPSVPKDLETICLKCLEKRPERRYHSARALSEELERFLAVEPIFARPAGRLRKVWSWAQRNPWAMAAVGGLAAFILFCVAYGLWEQNQFLASTLKATQPVSNTDAMDLAMKPAATMRTVLQRPPFSQAMSNWDVFTICPCLMFILFYCGHAFRMRHRRQSEGGAALSGLIIGSYVAAGILGVMVGMYYLRAQIHLLMWHLAPPGLLAAAGCPLVTVWLGLRMVWEAAGTHESSKYQGFVNRSLEVQLQQTTTRRSAMKLLGYGTLIMMPLIIMGLALQGLHGTWATWVAFFTGISSSAVIATMATLAIRNRRHLLVQTFIPIALGIFALPLVALSPPVWNFHRLFGSDIAAAIETIGLILLFSRPREQKPYPQAARWELAGTAAGLAILVVIFYAEENARGRAAWSRAERSLQEAGLNQDWKAYIPAPIPDSQNIFKAPHMQEWFVGRGTNALTEAIDGNDPFGNAYTVQWAQVTVIVSTSAPPPTMDSTNVVLRWMPTFSAVLEPNSNLQATNNASVEISFTNVPFMEAVKALGKQLGVNIACDPKLIPDRAITMAFHGVRPSQCLTAVLAEARLTLADGLDPHSKYVISQPRGYPGVPLEVSDTLDKSREVALGSFLLTPQYFMVIQKMLEHVVPAQIKILADRPLSSKEVATLFPTPKGFSPSYFRPLLVADPGHSNKFTVSFPRVVSANDVVAWRRSHDKEFNMIENGLSRPFARMEGDYGSFRTAPSPNANALKIIADASGAASPAHLLLNDPEGAVRDITFLHDLRRMFEGAANGLLETIKGASIDAEIAESYTSQIQDGLDRHVWTEGQLVLFDRQLADYELPATFSRAIAKEQIIPLIQIEQISHMSTDQLFFHNDISSNGPGFWPHYETALLLRYMPQGWWDQNRARYVLFTSDLQQFFEALRIHHTLDQRQLEVTAKQHFDRGFGPYQWFGPGEAAPYYNYYLKKLASGQTSISLCRIKCALERYRLSHHSYPTTLRTLVPELLASIPPDVIGGKQPEYYLKITNEYYLSSSGWYARERRAF